MSPLLLAEVDQLAAAGFGSQTGTLAHVTIDLLETGRSVQPSCAAQLRSHSMLTLNRRDFRTISPQPLTRRYNSCPTRCNAHQVCLEATLPDRFEAGRRADKRPSARLAVAVFGKATSTGDAAPTPSPVHPWTVWVLGLFLLCV